MVDFTSKYREEISQMMFTSGGIESPPTGTTDLVENIVRGQVIEMVTRCNELAVRRGARSLSVDDLFFLIRHNHAKLERLRMFLTWKEIRRNAKQSDEADGVDFADFDLAAAEDSQKQDAADGPLKGKSIASLPWDIDSRYTAQVPGLLDGLDNNENPSDSSVLHRLAVADARTRAMTREEYITWTEYRHASFTHRRTKRFREWVGFADITYYKPNDDFIDLLGFLALEVVQELTREALAVRDRVERTIHKTDAVISRSAAQPVSALFEDRETMSREIALEPRHVQEAFLKLQNTRKRSVAMFLNDGRVPNRFPLQLI